LPDSIAFGKINYIVMKYVFFLCSILCFNTFCVAQRPAIVDTSYKHWTTVNRGKISCDGNFVFYNLNNYPLGLSTIVLTSTNKSWQMRLTSYIDPNFSDDGKFFFAMCADTLITIHLPTKKIDKVMACQSYKLFQNGQSEWLIYQLNDSSHTLFVENLHTSKIFKSTDVSDYVLNTNASAIVLKLAGDSSKTEILKWMNLHTGAQSIIYQGQPIGDEIFDRTGKNMAFTTMKDGVKSIWHYRNGTETYSKRVASDGSDNMVQGYRINTGGVWQFSEDASQILFTQTRLNEQAKSGNVSPLVWSYKDHMLRSQYEKQGAKMLDDGKNLTALDVYTGKVNVLLHGLQKVVSIKKGRHQTFIVEESTFLIGKENPSARASYYIYSFANPILQPIILDSKIQIECSVSPDNKYVLYYHPILKAYLSLELKSGKTTNLTKTITQGVCRFDFQSRGRKNETSGGLVGWVSGNNEVIIQGTYDLFQLDLQNKKQPINLTHNRGFKNNTIYFLNNTESKTVDLNTDQIVYGFNINTKEFTLSKLIKKSFTELYRTSFFVTRPYINTLNIQKSTRSNAFLLLLGDVSNSPNYFFTKNFKHIKAISNNHPEKAYNWISSEILRYKDLNAEDCEGVLYKPDDFDPRKKYPVIMNYYLDISNQKDEHVLPLPSETGENIPVLVGSGYLFFKPNIYQNGGAIGRSALVSVLAAADHLASLSYVDHDKIGVSGHSLGGYETNYIITHTNRFKAALSGAGVSNLIQNYNSLWTNFGADKHAYLTVGPYKMEKGMEVIPEEYILNSPILKVNQINTPLLMVHNEMDKSVSVDQSVQFFVNLHKLKKPVWLVQYDQEGHYLQLEKNQIDFQEKVMSFFDHYLKGKPMANWMIDHISPEK